MTSALPVHVALVDETSSISADELAHVAGALNEQVLRDFAPGEHMGDPHPPHARRARGARLPPDGLEPAGVVRDADRRLVGDVLA
jgi:hypothetical protein